MPSTPDAPLREVESRALALMEHLGQQWLGTPLSTLGWTFHFDRARVRLGRCLFRQRGVYVRALSLSQHHAAAGWTAEVEDTVRHEIAHAIDFEHRGTSSHDAIWKAWARLCGAKPKARAGERIADPEAPWRAHCPTCSYTLPLYRRPGRRYVCPDCTDSILQVISRDGRKAFAKSVQASCPGCGTLFTRARRPRHDVACKSCCTRHAGGAFDSRFRLTFTPLP